LFALLSFSGLYFLERAKDVGKGNADKEKEKNDVDEEEEEKKEEEADVEEEVEEEQHLENEIELVRKKVEERSTKGGRQTNRERYTGGEIGTMEVIHKSPRRRKSRRGREKFIYSGMYLRTYLSLYQIIGVFLLTASGAVRSNGFLACIYLIPLPSLSSSLSSILPTLVAAGVQCVILLVPLSLYLSFAYFHYCTSLSPSTFLSCWLRLQTTTPTTLYDSGLSSPPRPWCFNFPPDIYRYIQKEYW